MKMHRALLWPSPPHRSRRSPRGGQEYLSMPRSRTFAVEAIRTYHTRAVAGIGVKQQHMELAYEEVQARSRIVQSGLDSSHGICGEPQGGRVRVDGFGK